MAAPGYGGPGWLWDCGYVGPWLWRPLAMAGRHPTQQSVAATMTTH